VSVGLECTGRNREGQRDLRLKYLSCRSQWQIHLSRILGLIELRHEPNFLEIMESISLDLLGFLSYVSSDWIYVDTLINLVKCTLQSVNLSLVKENQLRATSAQESSLISYFDFEHAANIEDELLCVVAGCLITLGPCSVLKVDDQNIIHVNRLTQKVVPLVKPEGKFAPYNSDQRYLSLLGYGTELILNEGRYFTASSYNLGQIVRTCCIWDQIK